MDKTTRKKQFATLRNKIFRYKKQGDLEMVERLEQQRQALKEAK